MFACAGMALALLSWPVTWQAVASDLPGLISGQAVVLAGDRIEIEGIEVRLWGIEAPKLDQTCTLPGGDRWLCGQEAAQALEAVIDRRRVHCQPMHRDPSSHLVARCDRDGAELGTWLVRNGWALDRPEVSDGRYSEEQDHAENASLGVWRGDFEPPSAWREK